MKELLPEGVQSLDKSLRENVRHLTNQNHEHFCLGTVCQGVAARARDTLAAKRQAAANEASELSEFFYANAVMGLFQRIANIVEQRGKLVDWDYSEGRYREGH